MKNELQHITKREDGRIRVQTINNEKSMTQQQYKDECDINNIMAKYATTGEFTSKTSKQGMYGDFSQITDYQDMLDTILYAQNAFNTLPAEVRKKFGNDPGSLLNYLQDEKNYDEGVKLGLIQKRETTDSNDNDKIQNNDDKQVSQPPVTKP